MVGVGIRVGIGLRFGGGGGIRRWAHGGHFDYIYLVKDKDRIRARAKGGVGDALRAMEIKRWLLAAMLFMVAIRVEVGFRVRVPQGVVEYLKGRG